MARKPQKALAQFVVPLCLESAARYLVNVHYFERSHGVLVDEVGFFVSKFLNQDSSLERYCKASAICSVWIFSEDAKSAIVLESLRTL